MRAKAGGPQVRRILWSIQCRYSSSNGVTVYVAELHSGARKRETKARLLSVRKTPGESRIVLTPRSLRGDHFRAVFLLLSLRLPLGTKERRSSFQLQSYIMQRVRVIRMIKMRASQFLGMTHSVFLARSTCKLSPATEYRVHAYVTKVHIRVSA